MAVDVAGKFTQRWIRWSRRAEKPEEVRGGTSRGSPSQSRCPVQEALPRGEEGFPADESVRIFPVGLLPDHGESGAEADLRAPQAHRDLSTRTRRRRIHVVSRRSLQDASGCAG